MHALPAAPGQDGTFIEGGFKKAGALVKILKISLAFFAG